MGKTKEQKEQEEFEEVTHNGFLVLFFIVATIVIGALCFIAGMVYSSYLNRDEERYEEKIKEEEEKEKDVSNEKIVEDGEIIGELDKKKEALMYSSHKLEIFNFFKKDISKKDLSNDIKMKIALTITQTKNDDKYTNDEIIDSMSKVEKKEYCDYSGSYLEVEDLNKEYFGLWGEEPKEYKTYQLYNRFIYLKDFNIYALNSNSGTVASPENIASYDYTITEDDYNYYLYTAIGVISYEGKVYNDISTYDIRSDNKEYTTFDPDDDYEIDKDNYEEFSKYKITFKKGPKNGIFFSRIERVQ